VAKGKKLGDIPAQDFLPIVAMVSIAIINLHAIYTITQVMNKSGAWDRYGLEALVGPALIGLRSVRVFGLSLLALHKKQGFNIFVAACGAEILFYIVMFLFSDRLMRLTLELLYHTPFELIGAAILMLVIAPIVLWNLIADRWESLK
jgi:hypothetical protein